MKTPPHIAVVGATGLVGQKMLEVLEKRDFPVGKLIPIASERSAGKQVKFKGENLPVVVISPEAFADVDIALFSAGGSTSKQWAPVAASKGAVVIDNSSAWRMDSEVPLCVPEVNLPQALHPPKGIIANPNCSTIQMLVALAPIHKKAKIKRIVVATYQAISGAGAKAVEAFEQQMKDFANTGRTKASDPLPEQLAGSLLMHWSVDQETLYQEEELKMVNETRKILGDNEILVSPTAVRVPVKTGHAEAITIETHQPMSAEEARQLLDQAPGLRVIDDFANHVYPKPYEADGIDEVLVGRIRNDIGNPGGIQMWVVADNLLKGAALNAVQIAEGLLR